MCTKVTFVMEMEVSITYFFYNNEVISIDSDHAWQGFNIQPRVIVIECINFHCSRLGKNQ